MPFNVLIASGLLSELRFEENKVEVCFENKERDEKVLFFRLKPELHEYYCLEENKAEEEIEDINNSKKSKKTCDLLIYYSRKDNVNDIICLVELKSDTEKISDALEQLKSSLSDFESKAIPEYASKYGKIITWTGCIFCNDEELLQSPYYPYCYIEETLETENQNKPPVFYDLDLFINDCRIEKHLRSVFSRIDKIQAKSGNFINSDSKST